jgi:hypothetical protein
LAEARGGEAADAPGPEPVGRDELERLAESVADEAYERLRALTVEAVRRRIGRGSLMSEAIRGLGGL